LRQDETQVVQPAALAAAGGEDSWVSHSAWYRSAAHSREWEGWGWTTGTEWYRRREGEEQARGIDDSLWSL